MRKRTIILFVAINFLFLTTVLQIGRVAVNNTELAALRSGSVRLDIDTCRGTVYDCNLTPLTNASYRYIAAIPPTAQGLAAIENYPLSDEAASRLSSGYPAAVEVDENFHNDNINIYRVPRRYDDICTHIIGYLNSEGDGVTGIEKAFNEKLIGGSLSVRFRSSSNGTILAGKDAVTVNDGYNFQKGIVLTIDKKIQQVAEDAAKTYLQKGAVVVLDVKTAAIRATVSVPSFDVGNIEDSLSRDDSPFVNRALCAYNVGSVFKLCVAAAALESGINQSFHCHSSYKRGDKTFHCQNRTAHGLVSLSAAMSVSCNCYFINLGKLAGAERLYNMMRSFGFGIGRTLADGIVSSGGTLPDLSSLQNNPAALANLSFGQGDFTATPLQIASMVQCIANDGALIAPSLVVGECGKNGKIKQKNKISAPTYVISEGTSNTLKSAMIEAVNTGTGKAALPISGGAGGKTATAETGQSDRGQEVHMTWFAGFFPAQEPEYAVAVLAENGVSGSRSAAPVFKEIADNVLFSQKKY